MTRAIKRFFATVDNTPCAFGCTYCFADFDSYAGVPSLSELEANPRVLDGVDVLYPACDVDVFGRGDATAVLQRFAALGPSLSLSTKASITRGQAADLRRIDDEMRARGAVLKIGVSVTTTTLIRAMEPHTPSYAVRLRTLDRLKSAGIARALVLRPLIEGVPVADIESILRDSSTRVSHVLIGDEWRDAQGPHEPQRVSWLPTPTRWVKIPNDTLRSTVYSECKQLGLSVYESDADLMAALLTQSDKARCSDAS